MYYIKLYFEYLKIALKKWGEYRLDSIFIALASILTLAIGVFNVEIIFTQVDSILGWTKYEILWILGYFFLVRSMFSTFFINVLDIGSWVHSGDLDVIRTRPASVIFQLLYADRYNTEFPVDEVIVGIALLIKSGSELRISFSAVFIIKLIGLIIVSTIIYGSIIFIVSSTSLWTVRNNYIMDFIFQLEELNEYPIAIYGTVIRMFLTFVIPIGFVSFYPNMHLLGRTEYMNIFSLTPIVLIILIVIMIVIWKKGIENYESPNS